MAKPLTIADRSSNRYLVDCRSGKLMVDAGWAGSLPQLSSALRRYDVELSAIKYVMMTHHHPDHAGLTQEVKRAAGARLLIHERQIPYLRNLAAFYRTRGGYEPIIVETDDIVVSGDGRDVLAQIGVAGQLVETPGHSEDSVSLLLDDGNVFIGDLHLPNQVEGEMYEAVCESWRRLVGLHAQTAYPGHGDPYPVQAVEQLLPG